MSDPDPPLPLHGHRLPEPPRDARAARMTFVLGVAIGMLGGLAASALLVSAWSLTDPRSTHGLTPIASPLVTETQTTRPSATAPSFSVATQPPAATVATRPTERNTLPSISRVAGTTRQSLDVDGKIREFWLHRPQSAEARNGEPAAKRPAVVMLHGAGGNGAVAELYTGFSALADREDFLVAYPSAEGEPKTRWMAGRTGTGAILQPDIRFIERLIETLIKTHGADEKRIYLCGHSSGGFMAYQFAGARPDLLAGVGVSAGSIGGLSADGRPMFMINPPRQPVPLIIFHGQRDTSIPYDESTPPAPGHERAVSVPDTVAYWVNLNRAFPVPQRSVLLGGAALVDTYRAMPGGAPVMLYTLPRGEHRWPGDATAASTRRSGGTTSAPADEVPATRIMWEFFRAATTADAPVR